MSRDLVGVNSPDIDTARHPRSGKLHYRDRARAATPKGAAPALIKPAEPSTVPVRAAVDGPHVVTQPVIETPPGADDALAEAYRAGDLAALTMASRLPGVVGDCAGVLAAVLAFNGRDRNAVDLLPAAAGRAAAFDRALLPSAAALGVDVLESATRVELPVTATALHVAAALAAHQGGQQAPAAAQLRAAAGTLADEDLPAAQLVRLRAALGYAAVIVADRDVLHQTAGVAWPADIPADPAAWAVLAVLAVAAALDAGEVAAAVRAAERAVRFADASAVEPLRARAAEAATLAALAADLS